ncbi:YdcH family protein [Photobacterium makurazakiensis]|uniref:YdcH family protein n=1 Tax=Photobacterium makurazakiensis TaxID=2910234 RepID=UPI003D135304
MLGEEHSLLNDFPEFKETINALVESDESFKNLNKQYNAMDKEIRTLELRGSPIADEEMHQLKHDRSELKDKLHQRVKAEKES